MVFLPFPPLAAIRTPASFQFHQNHIRSNLPDIAEINGVFHIRGKKAAPLSALCHHQLEYPSVALVHLKIHYPAQPLTVTQIDHFFTAEL